MSLGFTEVSTSDLKRAYGLLHRGDFDVPVTPWGLARVGLQHCQNALLTHLRGLDAAGVRAVLTCVLAERIGQTTGEGIGQD
ncbi:MAG: hypothetical protein Q8P18_17265 [Pseudomonadota bacterium]|nr:hypothetical protein [Pseudomonadota bacterium]